MENRPKISKEILDSFKPITGTATMEDDAMDFNRIPRIAGEVIATKKIEPKGGR